MTPAAHARPAARAATGHRRHRRPWPHRRSTHYHRQHSGVSPPTSEYSPVQPAAAGRSGM